VELDAELGQLRQAVADLSAQNLDLNNQLDRLVSSCERLVAGGEGGEEIRRAGGLQRTASFVGRAARKVVRETVGVARRVAGSRRDELQPLPDVRLHLGKNPAGPPPRIALVLRTSEDPELVQLPDAVRRQSDPDLDLVIWNDDAGAAVVRECGQPPRNLSAADPAAVAAALTAPMVADVGAAAERLHPTVMERCRWVLASEGLPLLVDGDSPRRSFAVEPAAVWAGAGSDGDPPPPPKLVKSVGGDRWGCPDGRGQPTLAGGAGRGYVAAEGTAETLEHTVAPLDGVVAPFPRGDDRLPVLVITSIRGAGLAGWLLRRLGDRCRFTVVATDGADSSTPVRGLTELTDRVYPIGGFLEPAVWASAAADVARAHQAAAILRVDSSLELPDWKGRPVLIDLPASAAGLGGGADLVLAPGRDTAAKARGRGQEVVELVPGPMPPGDVPDPGEAADVRAAYGVPADARLVVAVGDLDADRRPEDVAAVARRLRHREDLHFLLVGGGPLAGTVSDLAGYFELDRFTFAPPGHPLKELVAASDCVLSTAEVDPWPQSVSAALALGRGVVATDIDGVRELVAAAGFDRSILCNPGDLEGLAAAVIAVVDEHRRPRITQKAWKAAAGRSSAAARVVADALARGKKAG